VRRRSYRRGQRNIRHAPGPATTAAPVQAERTTGREYPREIMPERDQQQQNDHHMQQG
jgi:hypothetical protein